MATVAAIGRTQIPSMIRCARDQTRSLMGAKPNVQREMSRPSTTTRIEAQGKSPQVLVNFCPYIQT